LALGKGFEPLRARSPHAVLPFSGFSPLLFDLKAGTLESKYEPHPQCLHAFGYWVFSFGKGLNLQAGIQFKVT
jgi:hypothetical protein